MSNRKKILAIVAIVALVAVLGVCLVACNAENYTHMLEKRNYVVRQYTEDELEGVAEWGMYAYKQVGDKPSDRIYVTIVKYNDVKKAKNAKKFHEYLDEYVKRSGKIVYYGSEQAVDDVTYMWF